MKKTHHEEDHHEKAHHEENGEGSSGGHGGHEHPAVEGLSIQELEIRLTSNIDAYFRGDIVLTLEQHDGEFSMTPEEAFVETLFIPSVTIRAGKFLALLNRHNVLHTHYFPFVDAPLSYNYILGSSHGFSGTGVFLSYLFPMPWYMEAVIQGLTSTSGELFRSKNNLVGIAFLKNFWDITDNSTFELNLNFGMGKNSVDNFNNLYGFSSTLKWVPSKYRSLSWTSEYLRALKNNSNPQGLSSWVEWQFAEYWRAKGRIDFIDENSSWSFNQFKQKYSFLLGFYPTEYSALKFQYDYASLSDENPEHSFLCSVKCQLGNSSGALLLIKIMKYGN